jgi:hypothetical protein
MARSTGACVAIAAVAAAVGCGQTRGDEQGSTASSLTGRWSMFHWEWNAVTVDLMEQDGVLTGNGCCAGIDADSMGINCCAPVNGHVADGRASFGFSFAFGTEPHTYSTYAYVSADRMRMTGTFSESTEPVAWVRLDPGETTLPLDHTAAILALGKFLGTYALVLADDPAPGADFVAQQAYRLDVDAHFVFGELGPFWAEEMEWREAEQTMVTGPVPATTPGLPVALALHHDGTRLASVEATMASGIRYHFQATATQP